MYFSIFPVSMPHPHSTLLFQPLLIEEAWSPEWHHFGNPPWKSSDLLVSLSTFGTQSWAVYPPNGLSWAGEDGVGMVSSLVLYTASLNAAGVCISFFGCYTHYWIIFSLCPSETSKFFFFFHKNFCWARPLPSCFCATDFLKHRFCINLSNFI